MRLPDSAHTSGPWRVHEFTRDFRLYDVWALATPGPQLTTGGEELSARVWVVSAGGRLAVCRRDVFAAGADRGEGRLFAAAQGTIASVVSPEEPR